jgi:hypothetical protein
MQVVAEDAFLDDRLHLSDAIGRQVIGLVKRDLTVAGGGLAEDAIEDDEVVVGVDVERRAEAMKEADGSELGARRCSRAGASERGSNRAQEDLEHGTGDPHVVVEVGTQPLWHGEHPLPCGHTWQHVVGEVRGDLAHTPGVAGGANAAALAGERDQPLVAAALTAGPGEAMGQNAARQVAPEVALDPLRQSVAHGVGLDRPDHKGLEVMLHRLVQSRPSRAPRPVEGAREAGPMRRGGRTRTKPGSLLGGRRAWEHHGAGSNRP